VREEVEVVKEVELWGWCNSGRSTMVGVTAAHVLALTRSA
jgi:hypothetical protein